MKTGTLVSIVATFGVFAFVAVIIVVVLGIAFFGAWRARRRAMSYAAQAQAAVAAATPRRAPVEAWGAGCWGLWSGAEDSATWSQERAVKSLSSWYGANDPPALAGVIEGLYQGTTGNAAWDVVRAVDLLRIGVAAGYLSQAECSAGVRRAAGVLRGQYSSWEELASGFEQGMNAWQDSRGITDPNERGRVQRNAPYLRAAVWPTVAWGAAL